METTANNIANANTTDTETGEPYRRRSVVFSAVLDEVASRTFENGLGGVKVVGVAKDPTDFPVVYDPGHPHADSEGMVRLTNVKIPNEMVDLISASRSYEANLKAMSSYKEMIEQTLTLLRGGR